MVLIPTFDRAKRRRLAYGLAAFALVVMIVLGVFARNNWFPRTDGLTGKKYGWFDKELARNAVSTWNPFVPDPTPTPPQLSKEYIYAGSRLLAVEDANANAAPPADLAVWRPSNGTWYVLSGEGTQQTSHGYTWGYCPGGNPADPACDKPTPGDYDGDGKTDFAIWRGAIGTWYVVRSSDGTWYDYQYGATGDKPAVADFDGDGKSDHVLYRPSAGDWYIWQSSNNIQIGAEFGESGDEPVPHDYDGDGRADVAVWRSSNHTFYSLNTINSGYQTVQIGANGDKPTTCDYDGDGKVDFATFASGLWTIKYTGTGSTINYNYGAGSDVPVSNDYDGDGKCDRTYWHPDANARWFIWKSSTNTERTEYWGTTGDIPVPAFYRR